MKEVLPMNYPERLYRIDAEGNLIEPDAEILGLWKWVERFQNEYARQNHSPLTIIEYGYDLAGLVMYLRNKNISDFQNVDSLTLRDYLDYLRLNHDLSAKTMNRHLSTFRSFFRFLWEQRIITQNPATGIRYARLTKTTGGHTYLMQSEAKQLLKASEDQTRFAQRDLAMIALMLFCGLRISEVAGLNRGDIRWTEQLLIVRGKGNKIRELPMNEYVLKLLNDYLKVRPQPRYRKKRPASETPMDHARKQLEEKVGGQEEALFISSHLRRISTRGIRDVVDKAMEKVVLDDPTKRITPHKLRHTFATLLYLNGADINVLKDLLGHADLSSTQIYAAVDQQRKQQAMHRHPLLPENRLEGGSSTESKN